MIDEEVAEADAVEQALPVAPDAPFDEPALEPPPLRPEAPALGAEVPEADALEQAMPAPVEDDDRLR